MSVRGRDVAALRDRIRSLAERQHGHVTRQQLLALGASAGWIRVQIRRGWLIPVHAGVYALGHVPRDGRSRAAAAVLACGPGAALSHDGAAALWGVAGWPATLEVSAPSTHRRPGLIVHRCATLSSRDLRRRDGIPVTSPVRTALDLLPRSSDERVVRLVNDLRLAGHLGPSAMEDLRLRSARVDRLLGDGRPTRSSLEDRFRRFVHRHGLPMPTVIAILPENGREVDALYRDARLIIEIDSWRYHQDRTSFEVDREKDAAALDFGYLSLRITDRRLDHGGREEADRIKRILARLEPRGQAAS